jgi:hypothetical protein
MNNQNKFYRQFSYQSLTARCRQSCARLLKQIRRIKAAIRQEFAPAVGGYELLLSQALNEAEALAWQTSYPHLFFPDLAEEKASEVRHWASRQRAILGNMPSIAFAA